jgi:peptidoglycan/LPS O-acetylase OafA/YrhL
VRSSISTGERQIHEELYRQPYSFIDAIRGIAALSVVYLHTTEAIRQTAWLVEKPILLVLGTLVDPGKLGVALFFLVSGFVIPFSLKGRTKSEAIGKFCTSRAFRLYPLYWASILTALAVAAVVGSQQPTIRVLLWNFTMMQQFAGVDNLMGLYWTLQIEIIFYALCVALYLLGYLNRPSYVAGSALLFLSIAFLASLVRNYADKKVPVAVPLALCLMFIGSLWRRFIIEGDRRCGLYSKLLMAATITSMPFISLLAYNHDMGFHETWYRYTLSYDGSLAAFYLLTTSCKITNRWAVHLGRVSYSIYLMQGTVLPLYQKFALPHLKTLPVHVHVLIVSSIVIGISGLTFRAIEEPDIQLGKKLTRSIKRRADAQAAKIQLARA